MSEIRIKGVHTKEDRKVFVRFPFQLYKDNPYWIPPIINEELEDLDPERNPSFQCNDARLWLAYKGGDVVGRVCAIKHTQEFEQEKKIRFGWIDFIDDPDVSRALLSAVESWATELGAAEVHGPMGFTDMDQEGMLVDGFDTLGTIATIYNHAYYMTHMEASGYSKAADWVELKGMFQEEIDPKIPRIAGVIEERFKVKAISLKNSKDVLRYGKKMFEVLNRSYSELYGFYPISTKEAEYIVKKYLSFVKPSNFSVILNEEQEMIGFGVAMPSLSKAFQKANGSLFPFGFIHIVKALLFNRDYDFYLIGVDPGYANTGAIALVFYQLWKQFANIKVHMMHANPVLEDNERMIGLWQSIARSKDKVVEEHIVKRRRCYHKVL